MQNPIIYTIDTVTPNDPQYNKLWGLHNSGQMVNGSVGSNDADIDAPEAWDMTTGSSDVVVGVLDSGAAWNHEDLGRWKEIIIQNNQEKWSKTISPTMAFGQQTDNTSSLLFYLPLLLFHIFFLLI